MAKRLDPQHRKLSPRKSSAPPAAADDHEKDGPPGQKDKADWLASQLRELYGEVTREPVPENLLELLRKMKGPDAG